MKKILKKVSWIFLFCEKFAVENACCHIFLAIVYNKIVRIQVRVHPKGVINP
jgi:hypothetical protein